jgi:hypothetical protein
MKSLLFSCLLVLPLAAQVKVSQEPGRILVDIGGKPFTTLYAGADTTKPYLHPLRAASGTIVTRGYPMEANVKGESHDHPHHRGLWFSHGIVNGYDFWANELSQAGQGLPKGRIALKKVVELKSGAKSGSLRATFDWLDPDGKPIMAEDQTIVFYADPSLRVMDFDIVLSPLTKVTFGDTKEGSFAIRLAAALEEPSPKTSADPELAVTPRTGKMVSSEGKQGEAQVWGSRADWVDYFGELGGEKLGIAILDHPGNPRHPVYWHSRSYGLFAANPFGLKEFLKDKSKDGSLTVEPGSNLRFRYRVVIHPGDYQTAKIAEAYKKYAGTK